MASSTSIEWCDSTWNPLLGCSECSPGCDHCWARGYAMRFYPWLVGDPDGSKAGRWTGRVEFRPERLDQPLHWRKPQRIFACSQSDLFHQSITFGVVLDVWRRMAWAEQHTFLVLTKRPEVMVERVGGLGDWFKGDSCGWPLPNLWLGVTVCNQEEADAKIPLLLQTPAAVRWVSVEPMLGPVVLREEWLAPTCRRCGKQYDQSSDLWRHFPDAEPGKQYDHRCYGWEHEGLAPSLAWARPPIDWLVCGGESGPGARPLHPAWVRSVRDQCVSAGIPWWFKQWGPWVTGDEPDQMAGLYSREICINPLMWYWPDGRIARRVGKRLAGRILDGRTWEEVPHA